MHMLFGMPPLFLWLTFGGVSLETMQSFEPLIFLRRPSSFLLSSLNALMIMLIPTAKPEYIIIDGALLSVHFTFYHWYKFSWSFAFTFGWKMKLTFLTLSSRPKDHIGVFPFLFSLLKMCTKSYFNWWSDSILKDSWVAYAFGLWTEWNGTIIFSSLWFQAF